MKTDKLLRLGAATVIVLAGVVAIPSPASAAMSLTRVVASTDSDDSDSKSIVAECPANTRVLGGGAGLSGGGSYVHITGMQPNGTNNTFAAFAREHATVNTPWSLHAYAICAPQPAGLSYVSAVTGGDSAYSHSDYAFCPSGKKVLGFGGRVTANDTSKVFLTIVKPTGTGNGAEAAAVEKDGGYTGNWWLYTWAICADEPDGWEIESATNGVGHWYTGVTCQSPKKLTGAGAYINLSLGKVFLMDVGVGGTVNNPYWTDVAASWIGGSDYTHDWYIKAYGVCVS